MEPQKQSPPPRAIPVSEIITSTGRNPIEQLFALHGRDAAPVFARPAVAAPNLAPAGSGVLRPPNQPQSEPAAAGSVTDLAAEYAWLREERSRLEAYTLSQLSLLTQQREELAARRASVEATFALREQELNRQTKIVAERTELVQERERKLAVGEAEWSLRQEELARSEQQLEQMKQTGLKLQRDIDEQRLQLKSLRFQADQLRESGRAAAAELQALERMAATRTKEQNEEQAKFTARQDQLNARLKEIERGEESLRRREQELDDLEMQLRLEIEERQRQLDAEFQEIEEIRQSLRTQRPPTPTAPMRSPAPDAGLPAPATVSIRRPIVPAASATPAGNTGAAPAPKQSASLPPATTPVPAGSAAVTLAAVPKRKPALPHATTPVPVPGAGAPSTPARSALAAPATATPTRNAARPAATTPRRC